MATVDIKQIDMDERVWQQLLTLPYRIEIDEAGRLVMTALQEPAPTWEELATTHPLLPEDLGWKVETNAQNQIIMSPPPRLEHAGFEGDIFILLFQLLKNGRPLSNAGVKTSDGTLIPDVVWVTSEKWRANQGRISFPQAPEICIEVISPGNSRREIEKKKRLYFEAGALEVWRCERDGIMSFFDADGQLKKSLLCPAFPERLTL